MALSRAQAFVTKWWLALRHNLPFAWVYGVNVIWWLTLDRRPFEDPAEFAGVAELEEAWPEIREEFDRLRAATHTPMFGAIDPGQARLATDRWRAVLLWFWGQPSRTNLAECPRTAEVLSHIDGLQTALHSSLAPKASLPWHMGPYAGVLRVHLGIDVPRAASAASRLVGNDATGATAVFWCSTTPTPTPPGITATRSGWCCSSTSCGPCHTAGSGG
ncbi:MAG: aspartyl/asparaginyl beta-hydroxylase domain-containing protein [Candidatus Microthrix sp.]|nr:aspartyl/asparaginyl beta-hydroxylase domain-containing protein [Candidatus Microthrix sp.]